MTGSDRFKWVILFGCWLLYFVFGLAVSSLAPLVPLIVADLKINSSQMGTILGAWQFIYIFLAVPVGLMLHRLGPGRMLLFAAGLIAASGFMRAQATSYSAMLLAVALFGLGGPIVSAGVPQMVSRWFAGRQRGIAMGIYITGPALAGVVALSSTNALLLPWLGDWRQVLKLWAWCAVAGGVVWFVIWLASKRMPVAEGGSPGAPATSGLGDIAEMMRDRKVRLLLAMAIGIFTLDHGLRNWLPEILRTQGWSAAEAGYLATVPVVFGVVSALVFPGRATPERRIGVLQTLFGLAACGYLLLQTPFAATQLPGLVMVGLAAGSMMAICLLALIEQDAVSPARAGLAGGLFFAFAEIGGVGGPVIIGVLHDLTHGFGVSLVLLMLCAGGLILAAGRLRDR